MAEGKFVSYLRVSTDKQGNSGLGLEAQRHGVEDYLNGGRWKLLAEFVEVESGKKSNRPELEKAMVLCRKQKATLIVAKLDRLSRDAHFLLGLQKAKVEFVAADMPGATNFTVGIMAMVAQEEARMIGARTKAALAAAKARGVKLGSPKLDQARPMGVETVKANAQQRAENVLPIVAKLRATGCTTLQGIADALNNRGIPTARGGQWHPSSVRNVLARLES